MVRIEGGATASPTLPWCFLEGGLDAALRLNLAATQGSLTSNQALSDASQTAGRMHERPFGEEEEDPRLTCLLKAPAMDGKYGEEDAIAVFWDNFLAQKGAKLTVCSVVV